MATGTKPKTRQSMTFMSKEFGTGKQLLVSELPTVHDILQYGILLKEQHEGSFRNCQITDIAKTMMEATISQWTKANALFQPPVILSAQQITKQITDLWHEASNIALKKVKREKQDTFNQKLDKLLIF